MSASTARSLTAYAANRGVIGGICKPGTNCRTCTAIRDDWRKVLSARRAKAARAKVEAKRKSAAKRKAVRK